MTTTTKRILVISSTTDIEQSLDAYVREGALPSARLSYLIEYFLEDEEDEEQQSKDSTERVFRMKDFADHAALDRVLDEIAAAGPWDDILTTDEFSVHVAGQVRDRLRAKGATSIRGLGAEASRRFRDKVVMKQAIGGAVRTPRLFSIDDVRAGRASFPLIAKPRSLAGAVGVRVIDRAFDLEGLSIGAASPDDPYTDMAENELELEELIAGEIYVIDGLASDGDVKFMAISRYEGTALAYLAGKPLGCMVLPPADRAARAAIWEPFARSVVHALEVPNGVFHLEAFLTPEGEPVFLEIGARPGGGPIKKTILAICGVDLLLAHLRLQLGLAVEPPAACSAIAGGGWLLFPKRHDRPVGEVVAHVTLPEHEWSAELIEASLPCVGAPASGPFFCHEDALGTFVFRGTPERVKNDLAWLGANYRVETAAVGV